VRGKRSGVSAEVRRCIRGIVRKCAQELAKYGSGLLCTKHRQTSSTPWRKTLPDNSRESIIFRSHLELCRSGYEHEPNSCRSRFGNPPIQRNIIPRGMDFRRSDISPSFWRDDPLGQLLREFRDKVAPTMVHARLDQISAESKPFWPFHSQKKRL